MARQYRSASGEMASCQVAVTPAIWTGGRAWMLGAVLDAPEAWLTAEAAAARADSRVRFPEK